MVGGDILSYSYISRSSSPSANGNLLWKILQEISFEWNKEEISER